MSITVISKGEAQEFRSLEIAFLEIQRRLGHHPHYKTDYNWKIVKSVATEGGVRDA